MVIKGFGAAGGKDSLPVSDEEIDAEIDNKVRYYINQYGSKEIVEQIAGKTIYQLKEDFKQTTREAKISKRKMRNKIVRRCKDHTL